MGLLDDLKKQAELVKSQQVSQQSLLQDRLVAVEARMKQAFQYMHELLKQLAVLKPENPMVFTVPGVVELKGLKFQESFIDYRKSRVAETDVFDVISFYIKWSIPERIEVERDMPGPAQKVRDALFASGLKFQEEEVRSARGTMTGWKFSIDPGLVTDVNIRADREQGCILIRGKNLLRLSIDDFAVPAGELDETMLESFAATLLGQPGNFQRYRTVAPLR